MSMKGRPDASMSNCSFLGDGYLGDNVPLQTLANMTELQLDFGIECFNFPQS
jgi:hypothetical protein